MKEKILAKIASATTEGDLMMIAAESVPYIFYLPEDESRSIASIFCQKAGLAARICFFNYIPTKHAALVIGTPSLHKAIDEFNKFRYLYHKTIKEHSDSYVSVGHREVDVFALILSEPDLIQAAPVLYQMYEANLPRHAKRQTQCSLTENQFSKLLLSLKKDLIASFDFAKSKNEDLQKYEHLISR